MCSSSIDIHEEKGKLRKKIYIVFVVDVVTAPPSIAAAAVTAFSQEGGSCYCFWSEAIWV